MTSFYIHHAMMFETVDCERGAFLEVIFLVTKFCPYKSNFDLDICTKVF